LGRREANLLIHHGGAGTPDRLTVRKLAAQQFNTKFENVFVRSIATRTGGSAAICKVEVYDDVKVAERTLPAYLKNRNLPKDQRVSKKKGEAGAAPAAASTPAPKPAAKPAAEKAPAEKKAAEPPKAPKGEKKESPSAPAKEPAGTSKPTGPKPK
jgi:ribosomal protein S24E